MVFRIPFSIFTLFTVFTRKGNHPKMQLFFHQKKTIICYLSKKKLQVIVLIRTPLFRFVGCVLALNN